MTTDDAAVSAPLWLAIERQIQNLEASAFDAGAKEATVHSIAEALDEAGYNVSRHGGHLMQLRRAVDARIDVGSPLLGDFNRAIESLTLDDVSDTYKTTVRLVGDLGSTWSNLQDVDIRSDIQEIVDGAKLDLQVEKAKEMADDKGARYLLEEAVPENDIIERLAISREILDEVKKAVAAEAAEAKRIGKLLEAVAEASDVDKAKHLISNDVADADILEVAGLDQGAIDSARQAMEEELREKERLAAEAEAAKKAAAEGPALDQIPPDEMLEHIEAIREIMEFSEEEAEIRQMCEQSNIPKSLVDVAVSDADKLDELEKQAEG
jgi:hypothetical protein